jgi:hypothetical protein
MDQRHTLATRVHSYRSANDPASLKSAIAEVFGEIGGGADDVAGAEAFAELQPIPGEVAQAMIQALSSSGNQPIGERPRSRPAPTASENQPAPGQSPAPSSSASTPVSLAWGSICCVGFFGFFILGMIIRAIKKSRR